MDSKGSDSSKDDHGWPTLKIRRVYTIDYTIDIDMCVHQCVNSARSGRVRTIVYASVYGCSAGLVARRPAA